MHVIAIANLIALLFPNLVIVFHLQYHETFKVISILETKL